MKIVGSVIGVYDRSTEERRFFCLRCGSLRGANALCGCCDSPFVGLARHRALHPQLEQWAEMRIRALEQAVAHLAWGVGWLRWNAGSETPLDACRRSYGPHWR